MSLTLSLDYGNRVLVEPGFSRYVSTREASELGNRPDDVSQQGIWWDEPTRTIMLRPLQLDPDFLDCPPQIDSIIRLADMVVQSGDLSSGRISEHSTFNTANPWIHHTPAGPSSGFPAGPPPGPDEFPGAFGNSLTGYSSPTNLTDVNLLSVTPPTWYQPAPNAPAPTYTPVVAGGFNDGKFAARTATRLPANQGLLFRWFHPPSNLGFQPIYIFCVGQYALYIRDVLVQVYLDISPGGDRSSWQKIQQYPLFTLNATQKAGSKNPFHEKTLAGVESRDRQLLWLPYRRSSVLMHSSDGQWAVIPVRAYPKRLPDNSDWDITREDALEVWVMTPAYGRFQIQKLKYPDPAHAVKFDAPIFTVPYTPTTAPTVTMDADNDHGTAITGTRSQPPAYSIPGRPGDACPPLTGDPSTVVSRSYGYELQLTASSDRRWTPFFYGFQVAADPQYIDHPNSPTTVVDSGTTTTHIKTVKFSHGLQPGEGRMTAEIEDFGPTYSFGSQYYRVTAPIRLADSVMGTLFTGFTAPNEVSPLRLTTNAPRQVTITARDNWQSLVDTYLVDNRDWTGTGHIDVVDKILQLSGYDTTALPPEYPTPKATYNTPLGGSQITVAQTTKDLIPFWKPRVQDTAVTFLQRIADKFSGWEMGFYPNGQFFYRPRDWFTTSEVTFYETKAARTASGNTTYPLFRGPVTFTTFEPEANVVQCISGSAEDGAIAASALYIDWASIKTPAKKNYIGRWRAEVVELNGTLNCAQLNLMARRVFERTRRRYLQVRFEGDFYPALKVGHCFALDTYGLYRLQSFSCTWDTKRYLNCEYVGELVEDGIN